VLSVLWALGGGISERRSQLDNAYNAWVYFKGDMCTRRAKEEAEIAQLLRRLPNERVYSDCQAEAWATYQSMRELNGDRIASVVAVALLPTIAAWLLALFGIKVFRWIRAGFAPGVSPAVQSAQQVPGSVDKHETVAPAPAPQVQPPTQKSTFHFPVVALLLFGAAVFLIAFKLIARNAGIPALELANNLPVLANHPQAVTEYLAEATGMALVMPTIHSAVVLPFKRMRNRNTVARVFTGWSFAAAAIAMFM
jgi:hypothetical protein